MRRFLAVMALLLSLVGCKNPAKDEAPPPSDPNQPRVEPGQPCATEGQKVTKSALGFKVKYICKRVDGNLTWQEDVS
jgi:hypothetical protein